MLCYFQFQILWQPFPCVRNSLNKKHLVFLVCFCCIASHQSPISHITSSRRRANISSWEEKSSELGGKFDSLWTSVVGEELLPGRTWLQSEWMSTSQVLEFAAGTVEKYPYTTWFAIPLGGFQLNNTSAIQKYLKIPISNYFKCFLLPFAKRAVQSNNSFCKGSWSFR